MSSWNLIFVTYLGIQLATSNAGGSNSIASKKCLLMLFEYFAQGVSNGSNLKCKLQLFRISSHLVSNISSASKTFPQNTVVGVLQGETATFILYITSPRQSASCQIDHQLKQYPYNLWSSDIAESTQKWMYGAKSKCHAESVQTPPKARFVLHLWVHPCVYLVYCFSYHKPSIARCLITQIIPVSALKTKLRA